MFVVRKAQGVSRPETSPKRCRPLASGLAIWWANRSMGRGTTGW